MKNCDILDQRMSPRQTFTGKSESMKHSGQQSDMPTQAAVPAAGQQPRSASKSMHDGIAVWCDCCSCEMEPYWAEVAREMGVEFSDYED
jgi:hypothetical protein